MIKTTAEYINNNKVKKYKKKKNEKKIKVHDLLITTRTETLLVSDNRFL